MQHADQITPSRPTVIAPSIPLVVQSSSYGWPQIQGNRAFLALKLNLTFGRENRISYSRYVLWPRATSIWNANLLMKTNAAIEEEKSATVSTLSPREARKEKIKELWLLGKSAEEIGEAITPPATKAQVWLIAYRMGLPRRVKTEKGLTAPIIRAEEAHARHPCNPKQEGYRFCIRGGCGKRFWSPGAHVRFCPQHRQKQD